MKKLRLKALELGASELLTREQLKSVLGGDGSGDGSGDDSGTQCGTAPNCSTSSCTIKSGVCKGATGTCGSSNHGTKCSCAAAC